MDQTIYMENQVTNQASDTNKNTMEVYAQSQVITEEDIQEEEIIRPYQLRKLKDGDLFPLLVILRKIGLAEFKDILLSISVFEKEEKIGYNFVMDIAMVMIEHLPAAEKEIYDLWADISGIPAEEIKKMDFGTLPLMIMDTFKGVRNFAFFKVLFKSL